jgi:hypothetical protein
MSFLPGKKSYIHFFFMFVQMAFLFLLNEEHRKKELYFFMEKQRGK